MAGEAFSMVCVGTQCWVQKYVGNRVCMSLVCMWGYVCVLWNPLVWSRWRCVFQDCMMVGAWGQFIYAQ